MKKFHQLLGLVWLVAAVITGCLPGPGVEPPDNPGKTNGGSMDAGAPFAGTQVVGSGDTTSTGNADNAAIPEQAVTSGQTDSGCLCERMGADGSTCAADAGAACGCANAFRASDGGTCNSASLDGSCADSGEDCGVETPQTTQR